MDASPVLRLSTTPPTWSELTRLSTSNDIRDRAFASGELRIRHARCSDEGHRAQALSLYATLRDHSLKAHHPLREAIARGTLRGAALRARIEAYPADTRDHFVEELLDIAYPALEAEGAPTWPRDGRTKGHDRVNGAPMNGAPVNGHDHEHEFIPYAPSGIGEILHALDAVQPTPDDTFVDLGSGLGKVVLLTALLTDAKALGIERASDLTAHTRASATSLGLTEPRVRLIEADAREADLTSGTIFYLYVPFTGSVLDTVMTRLATLATRRRIILCAHALDPHRFPWLKNRNTPRFWLDIYESTAPR